VSEESGSGPGEFAPGSLVAGYRLEEQIGRGGMAVVYRAHDPRLDRDVALKILAPGLSEDEAFRQRFIRESRAAAGVDEPHIIPVHEAGEDRGVLFIAMRFVRGGDVRTLLDRDGPLPPGRATEIISQVASALDAAHARGLVHRDVKPANMLLEESPDLDRPDHVYLADFGLTKASLGQAVSGLTATGQFLGTLDYVAPEQVEGRPVDGRTDLYALGCAAFELLTGAPPFRGNEGIAVMYKQVSQAPPLLSSRRPGLAREADDVLNRALAKRPEDRYQSCREFAAALRRVFGLRAESEPQARPPRAPTEIAGPVQRPAETPAGQPEPGQHAAAAAAGPGATEISDLGASSGQDGPDEAAGPADQPGDDTSVIEPAPADHEPAAAAAAPPEPEPGPAPEPPAAGPPALGPRAAEPPAPEPQAAEPAAASAGPPTEAASIRPPTSPGLTDPSAGGPGGPPGGGYGGGGPGPGGGPRRPWWRSPVPIAVICVLVVVIGGGAFFLAGHHSGTGGGNGGTGGTVTATSCASSAPKTKTVSLKRVSRSTESSPFAVKSVGQYSFVSVKNGIEVWLDQAGKAPRKLRTIDVPGQNKGLTVTPSGQYLLSANGSGAVVLNVANAESGASPMVLGTMAAPVLNKKNGNNAVGVQVTPDNNFAFVTLQNTTQMAVFNLSKAISDGFAPGYFVGTVPLFTQPVGISSPSVKSPWIYVTSFQRHNTGKRPSVGALTLVNWKTAETQPSKSRGATVDAGCSPSRVVLTDHGSTVWVTARDSNSLLAFSASKLRSDPGGALLADIPVGPGPIGLTPADGGKRLIVADSNYATSNNGNKGAAGQLAIVDTAAVLGHQSIVISVVRAAGQPRQLTLAQHNTLLVTEQNPVNAAGQAGQLQQVDLAKLP
jgi:Protein kinase domain